MPHIALVIFLSSNLSLVTPKTKPFIVTPYIMPNRITSSGPHLRNTAPGNTATFPSVEAMVSEPFACVWLI